MVEIQEVNKRSTNMTEYISSDSNFLFLFFIFISFTFSNVILYLKCNCIHCGCCWMSSTPYYHNHFDSTHSYYFQLVVLVQNFSILFDLNNFLRKSYFVTLSLSDTIVSSWKTFWSLEVRYLGSAVCFFRFFPSLFLVQKFNFLKKKLVPWNFKLHRRGIENCTFFAINLLTQHYKIKTINSFTKIFY